tara:strand:+ start:1112 stop:1549 length:438 start_codon:yes stop_codon:yes gene_type:complete
MKSIIKNIMAFTVGWITGSIVNMGLIQLGHEIFPIVGLDSNDMVALAELMPTLEFEFFIFPFLAHALGTLVGAITTGFIAVNHKMKFSLGIGVLFLIGGITVNYILPGPFWFAIVDIVLAYIPMAWIGGKIVVNKRLKFFNKTNL